MSATCKHENADHLMAGEWFEPWTLCLANKQALAEQFRCLDCGAWLSLGPSKENNRSRIELWAAMLVAQTLFKFTLEEIQHWPWSNCPKYDQSDDGYQCFSCEADDLARMIAEDVMADQQIEQAAA